MVYPRQTEIIEFDYRRQVLCKLFLVVGGLEVFSENLSGINQKLRSAVTT